MSSWRNVLNFPYFVLMKATTQVDPTEDDLRTYWTFLVASAEKFRTCSLVTSPDDYDAIKSILDCLDSSFFHHRPCGLIFDDPDLYRTARVRNEIERLLARITAFNIIESLENGWSVSHADGSRNTEPRMRPPILDDSRFSFLYGDEQGQSLYNYKSGRGRSLNLNMGFYSMVLLDISFLDLDKNPVFRSGYFIVERYHVTVSTDSRSSLPPCQYTLIKPTDGEIFLLKDANEIFHPYTIIRNLCNKFSWTLCQLRITAESELKWVAVDGPLSESEIFGTTPAELLRILLITWRYIQNTTPSLFHEWKIVIREPTLAEEVASYEWFPRGTGLFAVASWYEQRLSVGNFDRPISHSVFGNIHPVFWRGARRGLESEPIEIPPTYFVKNLRDIRVRASPLDPSLHEDNATIQWLYQSEKLCHPNVLSINGVCRIPDDGFGVIFPCTGLKSLRELLHEEPGLDRLQLSLEISHGLAYLHQIGVVHGRLRAANVLVSLTGNAILSDPCLLEMGSTGFTEQYLKENVRWLAPEIVRGEPLSQASDSYSLGMVIFEVISGMAPYTKTSEVRLWDTVLAGQPPPLPARPIGAIPNNQHGNRLWHFLYSCWDCDPVNRPSAALASDFMDLVIRYRPQGPSLRLGEYGSVFDGFESIADGPDLSLSHCWAGVDTLSNQTVTSTCTTDRADDNHKTLGLIRSHSLSDPREIIRCLVSHGCENITTFIDPKTIGDYPVCTGGFGNIYVGNLHGGLRIAVKTPHNSQNLIEENPGILIDIAREIHTWSKCDHPNVLHFLGLAVFRGQIAMLAPWMENGNLPHYLKTNTNADRCKLCTQICDGVAYLHEIGIIHGDLKGDNILVSSDGVAVVGDFGGSILKNRSMNIIPIERGALTYRWAAPELLMQDTVDDPRSAETTAQVTQTTGRCAWNSKASDVYALGMTILEVISGRLPWHWIKNEPAIIIHVCKPGTQHKRPEKEIPKRSNDGDRLWNLLTNCWLLEPGGRPTALEVLNIMRLVTPEGLQPEPA